MTITTETYDERRIDKGETEMEGERWGSEASPTIIRTSPSAMGKVVTIIVQAAIILVALGALGVGIATLIFVLQDHNARVDAESATTTTTAAPPKEFAKVPVAAPIKNTDSKFNTYNSFGQLLSQWMSKKVDPCDDFYAFTCGAGGHQMSFDLSDDQTTASMLKMLQSNYFKANSTSLPMKQMKIFFDKCVGKPDYTTAEVYANSKAKLDDVLNKNPGIQFSLLFQNQSQSTVLSNVTLAQLFGYQAGKYGTQTLIQIGVDTDWKDPHDTKQGYSLQIDQPATWYRDTIYRKVWDTYYQHTIDLVFNNTKALATLYNINIDDGKLRNDAKLLTDMDYDLAMTYSSNQIVRRKYGRSYNAMTLADMQNQWPFVNWVDFVKQSLMPISDTTNVTDATRVIVIEKDMLTALNRDILSGKINPNTLNNYVLYSQVRTLNLPKLNKASAMQRSLGAEGLKLEDIAFEKRSRRRLRRSKVYKRELITDDSQAEINTNCAGETYSTMQWANTRLFVDGTYPNAVNKQDIRKNVGLVVRSILQGFRSQLDLLDWMSASTKRGAYSKIDNLVVNIAYPDWVLEDAKLVDYYKKLDINENDKYLTILDKINDFNLYEAFRPYALQHAADRTDFSSGSAVTNAWYQPEMNSITFPGGILHAPFYDPSYPAAVNFGSMGVIAGHELTHGFDDEGVQWDGTGVLKTWMDDSSSVGFNKMAQCVVDEYSGFCPFGPNKTCVDGAQTQGENIADNGGMQAAYKAFKAYEALNGPDPLLPGDNSFFTADQLFFLAFTQVWCQIAPSDAAMLNQLLVDVHSPSKYRVFGTIQNFPGFQKAFNCPANSKYAPTKHCSVWTSEPTNGNALDAAGVPVVKDNDLNVQAPEVVKPRDNELYNAYTNVLNTLEASQNFSIDPCEDFYQYSCGNYGGELNTFYDMDNANYKKISQQLDSPAYKATIQSSGALQKLQFLYNACIKETQNPTISSVNYVWPKVARMQNLLSVDIPLMGGTQGVAFDKTKLSNTLAYLSFEQGINTFITPMVDTNWLDPQNVNNATDHHGNQIFIDQPTAHFDRPYYENDSWIQGKTHEKYVSDTTTLVKAYAKQMGQDTASDLVQQIEDLLAFERDIVLTFTETDANRRIYKRQWNEYAYTDAAVSQKLDWKAFFNYAATPDEVKNWKYKYVFNEIAKTNAMLDYITDPNKAKLVANYFFVRILYDNMGVIPCSSPNDDNCKALKKSILTREVPKIGTRPRRIIKAQVPYLDDTPSDDAIHTSCASAVSSLADAQGRVYVDARFPTDADKKLIKDKTVGVMNNIRESMKTMLMSLDWMDAVSKQKALDKADGIVINPAFSDDILNNTLLDKEYSTLILNGSMAYYDMVDMVAQYNIKHAYTSLTAKKANRNDFGGQTAVVNAWYAPELNAITFPSGILQDPYFNPRYPSALNYGGLGVVAGHELTHGFDDEGVQWTFDGTLNSWMNTTSQAGFNKMAQCVIDQYNTYCPLDSSFQPNCTNGVRTQGENIADNGGIHSAWRAYQSSIELNGPDPLFADRVFSQYTENQLYFRNFAQVWCMSPKELTTAFIYKRLMTDPHSLGPFRVLGTLSNIPAFKASFNCRAQQKYAPNDHCKVWVPTNYA